MTMSGDFYVRYVSLSKVNKLWHPFSGKPFSNSLYYNELEMSRARIELATRRLRGKETPLTPFVFTYLYMA